MGPVPDSVFLALGLAYLMVLLSIRNELRRANGRKKRRQNEWSFEDREKHRIKYLRHCKHIEFHLNKHRQITPDISTKGLAASG
jgi:hypothetical protein